MCHVTRPGSRRGWSTPRDWWAARSGLAALTTLATSHAASEVASGTEPLLAQTNGYQLALLTGSGLCLLGALAAALMLRVPRAAAAAVEPATAEST